MPKQSEIKQDRIEEAAKLSYQYAFLVDDKDIDRRWAKEESKDRWYELARQLFPQPLEKCPKCDGSGRVYICVGQMNEFYEKCPDCNGTGKIPQPLDDKELIKGIADIIDNRESYPADDGIGGSYVESSELLAGKIYSALLPPKIEEAMKKEKIEAFARLCNMPEAEGYDWVMSKEALEWLYMMRTNAECQRIIWQALKGSN